jgi:hypothetical protein
LSNDGKIGGLEKLELSALRRVAKVLHCATAPGRFSNLHPPRIDDEDKPGTVTTKLWIILSAIRHSLSWIQKPLLTWGEEQWSVQGLSKSSSLNSPDFQIVQNVRKQKDTNEAKSFTTPQCCSLSN